MEADATDPDTEEYLLWVLADSNLPTGTCMGPTDLGGFIASAGLESYHVHGFLTHDSKPGTTQQQVIQRTVEFVSFSLMNYVKSSLPYFYAAYRITRQFAHDTDLALRILSWLDWQHHTLILNHVSRRASMIQGSALLSLYAKSFARPDHAASRLIDQLRTNTRRGSAKLNNGSLSLQTKDELAGHLAICSGVFSAAVGLSLDRALRQNLFLQARNIMSCSIRLNTIGPYMAHQLLTFQLRHLVGRNLELLDRSTCERLYDQACEQGQQQDQFAEAQQPETDEWDWDWFDGSKAASSTIPCTTWPLGEIVQARHDQLHSRLFNS